tara:strand:+ start:88 stop:621 length:534 start_codon:yes stop_codon:yes gene_type:complete
MDRIDLDLDNENEMTFNVVIEGTRPGEPLCRLMIENEDMSFSMQGDFLPGNEVSIVVPPLKGILKEGSYDSYLEVLVDDRVFIPLEMKINFEESVKVMAEAVKRKKRKPVSASASLVSASVKKDNNKEERKVIMKEEAIEESKPIHPAKKRRDERKVVTGDDITSMVSALRKKLNRG